jgi:hypothetical protein
VASNSEGTGDIGATGDDPYGPGWWVASDGSWHSPDEDFGAGVPKNAHPIRTVAVVLLVLLVIGATTIGVWAGSGSQANSGSASTGPSPSELTAQVAQTVTGTGTDEFGVAGVVRVVCDGPSRWSPGETFTCDAYDVARSDVGQYDGRVQPTTSSGYWQWIGTWHPSHRHSSVE